MGTTDTTGISMIIVAHGAGVRVRDKVLGALSMRRPEGPFEVVVALDGAEPGDEAMLAALERPELVCCALPSRVGKNAALNAAVAVSRGPFLVFTDVDAVLEPDSLMHLLKPFADPSIGGVCGQRVITGLAAGGLSHAQRDYVRLDSAIKQWESRHGSITANDGKLYAMRRALFLPVPDGVTDDLFNCLTVVKRGFRFVFCGAARARVALPSRTARHELQRRRRIVCRSLRGLVVQRAVLNPWRYGGFALRLWLNKVGRRLWPLGVPLAVVVLWRLEGRTVAMALCTAGVSLVLGGWAVSVSGRATGGMLARAARAVWYAAVGGLGTVLGVIDLLRGRRYVTWAPRA